MAKPLTPPVEIVDTLAGLFKRCAAAEYARILFRKLCDQHLKFYFAVEISFAADHTITAPHEADAKLSFSLSLLMLGWPMFRRDVTVLYV
jgi:hypothetical protein